MIDVHEQLLGEIEAFTDAKNMAASTFGRYAVNDGKLVDRLRSGKTVTMRTVQAVRQYIAQNSAADSAA